MVLLFTLRVIIMFNNISLEIVFWLNLVCFLLDAFEYYLTPVYISPSTRISTVRIMKFNYEITSCKYIRYLPYIFLLSYPYFGEVDAAGAEANTAGDNSPPPMTGEALSAILTAPPRRFLVPRFLLVTSFFT